MVKSAATKTSSLKKLGPHLKIEQILSQFNRHSIGVCFADIDGNIQDTNPTFCLLTGYTREELSKKNLIDLEPEKSVGNLDRIKEEIINSGMTRFGTIYRRKDGGLIKVNIEVNQMKYNGQPLWMVTTYEVEENLEAEDRNRVITDLLRLFLHTSSRKNFLKKALTTIRDMVGVTAAGIRVADEHGNIPYEAYTGFSNNFIKSEKWLSTKKHHCACIRIILGTSEKQDQSEMTLSGSFCCNSTSKFINSLSDKESKRYRGYCITAGFESLAIIPIRYQKHTLGAIHLADKREGMFSSNVMEFIETSIAPLIGEGIYRYNIENRWKYNLEIQTVLSSLLKYSLDNVSLDEVLNNALDLIHKPKSFSFGEKSGIFLIENDPNTLIMKVSRGLNPDEQNRCKEVPLGKCVCGRAAIQQHIQYSHEADDFCELIGNNRPHGHYCVPIVMEKTTLGIINVYLDEDHREDVREEEFLTAVANTLAGIIMRKRSEEKLRIISRRLVSVQEEERRSIALELHDQIGQLLTGLNFMLSQAQRNIGTNPSISEAQVAVTELIVKVREMSLNLRPSMLDDLGLLPALQWHFEQVKKQSKLNVEFKQNGLERQFPKDISITVFRIVQEALTNIMRHAGVNEAFIEADADDRVLRLVIKDEGVGFITTEALAGSSVGLHGMRERAALLGGNMGIYSTPGIGTTIFVELPIGNP